MNKISQTKASSSAVHAAEQQSPQSALDTSLARLDMGKGTGAALDHSAAPVSASVAERREYLEWLAIYFLTHDRVARLEDLKPELRDLALQCGWIKPAGSAAVFYMPAGELEEMIGQN